MAGCFGRVGRAGTQQLSALKAFELSSVRPAGFAVCELLSLKNGIAPAIPMGGASLMFCRFGGSHMVYDPKKLPSKKFGWSQTDIPLLSVDESPYRLREALLVRKLWREGFENGQDHIFTNLTDQLRNITLWQNLYAHLTGAKTTKEQLNTRKGRARFEEGLGSLMQSVVDGEFQWHGESGLHVQGEVRRGLELRNVRRAMKDMDELVETEARRLHKNLVNPREKMKLDAYFQDRLVQEVLRVVLEPAFETMFLPYNHGFRPGRTQHTCLRHVRRDFHQTVWFYKGDFRRLFQFSAENRELFKDKLVEMMRKRIDDPLFFKLLGSGLSSRAIMSDYDLQREEGYSPLSVKSGLMQLLSNIYLHDMDKWFHDKIPTINHGMRRRINPERAALILKGEYEQAGRLPAYDPYDPEFKRLAYTRFADDFLFAVAGERDLALRLKDEFFDYAEKKMGFPLKEVDVQHIEKDIAWLGHKIARRLVVSGLRSAEKNAEEVKKSRDEAKALAQELGVDMSKVNGLHWDDDEIANIASKGSGVDSLRKLIREGTRQVFSIECDVDKIVGLLEKGGYCEKDGTPIPNFRHMHFPQSETNIIIRKMLLSICDFFKMAHNRQRVVVFCSYILRHSTAKMYAAKFKLKSRAKVFKRGGRYLDQRIKLGRSYIGMVDPDTGEKVKEEYVPLPYTRICETPRAELDSLSAKWTPELIVELKDRVLRTPTDRHRPMPIYNGYGQETRPEPDGWAHSRQNYGVAGSWANENRDRVRENAGSRESFRPQNGAGWGNQRELGGYRQSMDNWTSPKRSGREVGLLDREPYGERRGSVGREIGSGRRRVAPEDDVDVYDRENLTSGRGRGGFGWRDSEREESDRMARRNERLSSYGR